VQNLASVVTDPINIAMVLTAVACFATFMTLAMPLLQQDKLQARLKEVAVRREALRKANRAALNGKSGLKREASGVMNDTVNKLNLQKALEDPNVSNMLMQAGLRGPGPVAAFYFCRFALPFAFGVGAFLYITFVNDHGLQPQMKLAVVVFAAAAGFYAPNIYVSNLSAKRKESIMRAFPDALDMMLICVESGMSIEVAFIKVGAEIGPGSPELAEELAMTTAELSYLPDRRQAYENLAKRTNHPGVKGVSTALIQAERYGTPMGSALRTMAKENREMRMAAAEKKAAALPAQLTVPMIVFFLPVLFLVILGPAYIKFQRMQAQN
jgi:tight adherence protein C